MTELHYQTEVHAPVERVWSVLADLEAVQHYNPTVSTAHYVGAQRDGVGATRRCELKPKGHVVECVAGWEPMRSLTMELKESEWPIRFMRWRYDLRPADGKTVVTMDMQYQLKFGVFGALLDRLVMRRKFEPLLNDIFSAFARYAETQAGGRAGRAR